MKEPESMRLSPEAVRMICEALTEVESAARAYYDIKAQHDKAHAAYLTATKHLAIVLAIPFGERE